MLFSVSNENVPIFSAGLSDGALKAHDGAPPMLLQVSKVKVSSRQMTTAEITKGKEDIGKTIEAVDEASKKGTSLFNMKNLKGLLKAAGGVGDIIKGVRKFTADSKNPIVKNLQVLEDKVKQLENKMTANFDELKSFLTEVNFYVNITSPTSILTKYMRDCLKHPGPEAVKNFRKAYEKYTPLNLIYILISFLEHKSTNPVRLAMESVEMGNRKEVFQKWLDIIKQLLGQFLILEAFATGLLGFGSDATYDQLIEESQDVFNVMSRVEEECQDKEYWKEMKGFMKDYLENHKNLNNAQKADEIAAKLGNYYTSSAFYVLVFNNYGWDWRDNGWGVKYQNYGQVIISESTDCNAIIYRSLHANHMPSIEFENTEREVKACKTKKYYDGIMEQVIEGQFVNAHHVRGDGFVFLIDRKGDLEVRSANCPGHKWGPGWWEDIDSVIPWTLLVGLP